MKEMTDSEFEAEFEPIRPPTEEEGDFRWTIQQIYNARPEENRIWTIVDDGDVGNEYVVPGYAFVNRQSYIVTKKPWDPDETYNILWWDQERFDAEEGESAE